MFSMSFCYQQAVRLLLFANMFLFSVQVIHGATNPENAHGLSVDYIGSTAAGTLMVKLTDAIAGSGLSGIKIVAREIRADGLDYWAGEEITDGNGLAEFRLNQLGSGGRYYLRANVWHDQPVYTQTLTAHGKIVWKIGRVRVQVQNATLGTPAPLPDYRVGMRRQDGSWNIGVNTDSQGILRLDPPGLDKGIGYTLKTISPLGGYWETSSTINAAGTYTFKVGNKPLVVTLRKAIPSKLLADRVIDVWERLPDGTTKYAAKGTTNTAGRIVLELDGLGRGSSYFLVTNPFGVRRVKSGFITETGEYEFLVGNTPVTLIDDVSGKALAGKQLVAFTVAADKSTTWLSNGQTDANGTVYFDFPELETGSVVGIRANDPFGSEEQFFSSLVREQGPVRMRISEGYSERLDLVDPMSSIVSPARGKAAPAGGFLLQGLASDDREIKQVHIQISSGDKQLAAKAYYSRINKRWYFFVTEDMLVAGSRAVITATAIDATNNRHATTVGYSVINDTQAPLINVFSHQDNARVSVDGFTLKGTVSDDVAVSGLYVRVEDLNGEELVPAEWVMRLPGSERWAHNLFPRRWSRLAPARIVVMAGDYSENRQEFSIQVTPEVAAGNDRRMVDRITFGATPTLVQQARNMSWVNFLERQLAPEQIDDSAVDSMLDTESPVRRIDLVWRSLQRMIYSERQLLELMTWFWDNHFNTDLLSSNVTNEYNENEAFREHALGRFRDLLEISAKSPAMLRYLDGDRNYKRSPNENYARELMELHTLGVDGGYTQHDIEELARVLSGWHVQEDRFYFRATAHDANDKQFLGTTIRGGGVEEGEQALDILASHPSTARYICGKLVRFFVSDRADSDLVANCATTFVNTNGDIREILRRILKSEAFYEAVANNTRFKTPLRFATGVIRALDVSVEQHTLPRALQRMGMDLYRNPVPTGWPVAGDSWINANQLVQRINLLIDLFNDLRDSTDFNLVGMALEHSDVTGAGILGMYMDDFFARRMTYREYREALFHINSADVFDINAVGAEERLRQTLRLMLASPASHVH